MGYTVKIDKESCLSSGRCVAVAPRGFGFDDDQLAEILPGAASLPDERLVAIAKSCPASAILLFDQADNEIDPFDLID